MKRLFVILFILSAFINVSASDTSPQWVKDNLKLDIEPLNKKSEAIYVFKSRQISFSEGYSTIRNRVLIRIIKTTGLGYGSISVYSNTESKVEGMRGWRFDEKGTFLEALEKDNINERAYNESFHDDSTQVFARFKNVEKGDFIAYEYIEKKHVFFNNFVYLMGASVDVIRNEVSVSGNADIKVINDPEGLVKKTGDTYYLENFCQLENESYDPPLRDRVPLLFISFDRGKYSSWDDFAKDYWRQSKHAMTMSEITRNDLNELLSVANKEEFIRKTIEHVTSNVNYVDIEFGKGGYIPRTCDFVNEKKYGDCKDKAFYAAAILKERGFKAYPVLAKSRAYGKVYPEFVANQFNHAILAIELDDDLKQLENLNVDGRSYLIADMTDRYTIPPRISSSLENANLLIVFEDGGKIVSLNPAEGTVNKRSYDMSINYMFNQDINVSLIETFEGKYAVSERRFRENLTSDKEKEKYVTWVQDIIPGAGLKSFDVNEHVDKVVTQVEMYASNYGIQSDNSIYFIPNIIDSGVSSFKKRSRSSDIYFWAKTSNQINMDVKISSLFSVDEIPANYETDNRFFKGSYSVIKNEDVYQLEKTFVWKVNEIKKENYKEFRKEYRRFMKAVKAPFVLSK